MPIDAIVNFFDTLLIPIVVEVESFRFRSLIDPACIIAIAEHIYSSLSMTDIIIKLLELKALTAYIYIYIYSISSRYLA